MYKCETCGKEIDEMEWNLFDHLCFSCHNDLLDLLDEEDPNERFDDRQSY